MPVSTDPTSELTAAIDTLSKLNPSALADGETLLRLYRQRERLDAITTWAAAAFDVSGEWKDAGARSAAAWLTAFSRLPVSTCRRTCAWAGPSATWAGCRRRFNRRNARPAGSGDVESRAAPAFAPSTSFPDRTIRPDEFCFTKG